MSGSSICWRTMAEDSKERDSDKLCRKEETNLSGLLTFTRGSTVRSNLLEAAISKGIVNELTQLRGDERS